MSLKVGGTYTIQAKILDIEVLLSKIDRRPMCVVVLGVEEPVTFNDLSLDKLWYNLANVVVWSKAYRLAELRFALGLDILDYNRGRLTVEDVVFVKPLTKLEIKGAIGRCVVAVLTLDVYEKIDRVRVAHILPIKVATDV